MTKGETKELFTSIPLYLISAVDIEVALLGQQREESLEPDLLAVQ